LEQEVVAITRLDGDVLFCAVGILHNSAQTRPHAVVLMDCRILLGTDAVFFPSPHVPLYVLASECPATMKSRQAKICDPGTITIHLSLSIHEVLFQLSIVEIAELFEVMQIALSAIDHIT
jgi:hypothetical protein